MSLMYRLHCSPASVRRNSPFLSWSGRAQVRQVKQAGWNLWSRNSKPSVTTSPHTEHLHLALAVFLDAISISTVGCETHVTLRFFDVERV